MATYSGPAIVIDHTGEEHEVQADLSSTERDQVTGWRGTLRGSAPWFDMHGVECTLRVGTREAPFTVVDFGGDDGPANIDGSDAAPFAD